MKHTYQIELDEDNGQIDLIVNGETQSFSYRDCMFNDALRAAALALKDRMTQDHDLYLQ